MAVAITRDLAGRVIVPPRPPGMRRRALRAPVHAMIGELARDWGKCFATEAGLRRELYRRTGYVCGVRSIARVIRRSVVRGELGQERVAPYARRVDGERGHPGTTHTWVIARRAQRKTRRRARELERQSVAHAERARQVVQAEVEARAGAEVPIADEGDRAMRIRTAIAAIQGVQSSAQRGATVTKDVTLPAHHPRSIEEQLRALERAGFEVPNKKPPDE